MSLCSKQLFSKFKYSINTCSALLINTKKTVYTSKLVNTEAPLNIVSSKSVNPQVPVDKTKTKAENISHAMISFLERSAEYNKIMQERETEFEIGKRYLARIMGKKANETMDETEIEKAIEYLLPSSLTEKKARPFMKHPKYYYPKIKDLQFDNLGRPFHYLFFTGNPSYYELIDNAVQKLEDLNKIEDVIFAAKSINVNARKQNLQAYAKFDDKKSTWISATELAELLKSKITEDDHKRFVAVMETLANHPYSAKETDFIMKYRKRLLENLSEDYKKELKKDQDGTLYQTFDSKHKNATTAIRLQEGTGKVRIESPEGVFDITYFRELKHREQILFPFKIVNAINKYDLFMTFNQGGMSSLSKAARYSISRALCSFITFEEIEKLRVAGLLTPDTRRKERKKYGQEGARRKFTWKRR